MKTIISRLRYGINGRKVCSIILLFGIFGWLVGCKTHADGRPEATKNPSQIILKSSEANQSEPLSLREGDVISVVFPGSTTLNTSQQIRRDGKVVLPLIGEVTAAGKTPAELQAELIKLYAPQIASQQVVVTVQSSAYPVYVTGAVLHPGKVMADRPMSALDAIMEAGGFDYTKADLKAVVVIRQENKGTKKYSLNLKSAMAGAGGKPFFLKPSDIVYIPEKFNWF